MIFNYRLPKLGDTRIRKMFLFFPCTISNQTRWWKTVMIGEIYTKRYHFDGYGYVPDNYWEKVCFMD